MKLQGKKIQLITFKGQFGRLVKSPLIIKQRIKPKGEKSQIKNHKPKQNKYQIKKGREAQKGKKQNEEEKSTQGQNQIKIYHQLKLILTHEKNFFLESIQESLDQTSQFYLEVFNQKSEKEGKLLIVIQIMMLGRFLQRINQNLRKIVQLLSVWLWRGTEITEYFGNFKLIIHFLSERSSIMNMFNVNDETQRARFEEYWPNQEENELFYIMN